MEQHFATHQLATSKTDDSTSSSQSSDDGDDSENFSVIVQQQQQPQQQQQFQQLEVHCSFLLPVSLKFLIGAKSLIEMGFTY